jgi:hypothetical protein
VVKQAPALVGRCGPGEAGPVAAARVGRQRELADQQQPAVAAAPVDVLHAAVHLAGVVRKNAQLQQLGHQALGMGIGVATLGAHQHQQAGADLANHLAFHHHPGLTYSLNQGQHQIRSF